MYEAFFRSLRSTVRLHGEDGSPMTGTVSTRPVGSTKPVGSTRPVGMGEAGGQPAPRRRPLVKRLILRVLRPFAVPVINRFQYYVQQALDHGQTGRNISALDLRIAELDLKLLRLTNANSTLVRNYFSDMHKDVLGLDARIDGIGLRLDRIDARLEEVLTGFGERNPDDRHRLPRLPPSPPNDQDAAASNSKGHGKAADREKVPGVVPRR